MSFKIQIVCFCAIILCVQATSDLISKDIIESVEKLDREAMPVYLFGGLSINKISDSQMRSINMESTYEPIYNGVINYLNTHELKFSMDNIGNANVEGKYFLKFLTK